VNTTGVLTTRISIIITTFNQVELTRRCLQSIADKSAGLYYETIIVDNHSTDGTVAFLQAWVAEHESTHLILNQTNLGFPAAINQGSRAASGTMLVILNNDIVVTRGWLAGLASWLQDPAVGMVGPVTNASGNETLIEVSYRDLEEMEEFASGHTSRHMGESFEIPMLPLHCVAMRREVFDMVGPLDERFGIGMFEDDDYALRVRQKGYKIICAEDVFIHHEGGASFYRLSRGEYWRVWQTNRQLFEAKWGTRWHAPHYRPAMLGKQVDQMADAMIANAIELAGKDQELQDIHSSTAWSIVRWMWRIRLALFPHGSRREKVVKKLLQRVKTA
jgi:GT2 family glycosyltransferase